MGGMERVEGIDYINIVQAGDVQLADPPSSSQKLIQYFVALTEGSCILSLSLSLTLAAREMVVLVK